MEIFRAEIRLMSECIRCELQYMCFIGSGANARLFSSQRASCCYGDLAGKSINKNNNIINQQIFPRVTEVTFTPVDCTHGCDNY